MGTTGSLPGAHLAVITASRSERAVPWLEPLIKRAIDIVVACVLLGLLVPMFVVIALVIKLESPGPVFYKARRTGRHGADFGLLKFRKMRADAVGPPLTSANDERFTRLGRVLARFRLDELPQLLNVLLGDMSLVGPRPEDPRYVALRPDEFREVLTVPPGITGWTQLVYADEAALLEGDDPVQRYTTDLLPRKVELDRLYARTSTVMIDLKLLFWTPLVVFFGCSVEPESSGVLRLQRLGRRAPAGVAMIGPLHDRREPSVVIDLRDAVIDWPARVTEPDIAQVAH